MLTGQEAPAPQYRKFRAQITARPLLLTAATGQFSRQHLSGSGKFLKLFADGKQFAFNGDAYAAGLTHGLSNFTLTLE
jgi:hypothetical protein